MYSLLINHTSRVTSFSKFCATIIENLVLRSQSFVCVTLEFHLKNTRKTESLINSASKSLMQGFWTSNRSLLPFQKINSCISILLLKTQIFMTWPKIGSNLIFIQLYFSYYILITMNWFNITTFSNKIFNSFPYFNIFSKYYHVVLQI